MKKILLATCIVSAAALSACVDLDLAPLSEGSSETWYSSQSEIEMSLNDFYRTDFFPIIDKSWGDDVTWRNNTQSVQNGTMTAEDSGVATRWQNYYKGIARALRLLGKMDNARAMGIAETEILRYEGEAYFYMGYAYGMLAFFWGDAILDKTGMTLEEAYQAVRSPKADVLEFAGEMKLRDLNLRSDLASCRVIEMTLQPHTAKILKVEGERIEPVLYEAEWGYCPDFTAIRGTGVKYIPVEGASGRAVATNLGDSPTNYLEWADVFSLKGGKYRISVRFSSPEAVDFDLVVNGKAHHASVATTDSAFVEIPFEVEFLKGENDVRISGVTSSKVALDCLKVTKL